MIQIAKEWKGKPRNRHRIVRVQALAAPPEMVTPFFENPENLETLTPPFLRFKILTPGPMTMREGAEIDYALKLFRIPIGWRSRIQEYEPGKRFVDVQVKGPFASWHHQHIFHRIQGGTLAVDIIDYSLPLGFLGRGVHVMSIRGILKKIFDFRARELERRFGRLDGSSSTPIVANV